MKKCAIKKSEAWMKSALQLSFLFTRNVFIFIISQVRFGNRCTLKISIKFVFKKLKQDKLLSLKSAN